MLKIDRLGMLGFAMLIGVVLAALGCGGGGGSSTVNVPPGEDDAGMTDDDMSMSDDDDMSMSDDDDMSMSDEDDDMSMSDEAIAPASLAVGDRVVAMAFGTDTLTVQSASTVSILSESTGNTGLATFTYTMLSPTSARFTWEVFPSDIFAIDAVRGEATLNFETETSGTGTFSEIDSFGDSFNGPFAFTYDPASP